MKKKKKKKEMRGTEITDYGLKLLLIPITITKLKWI
jgi:hypothetical protein